MALKLFQVEINGQNYDVFVTSKYQKNIYFRFKDGSFFVTCPPLTSKKKILDGVVKFGPRLMKKSC